MAFHLLRILLFLASLLIIVAGGSFYIAGPSTTLAIMLDGIRPLLPNIPPITDMGTANVDSELRFFAPFFVAYGVLLLYQSRKQARRKGFSRVLYPKGALA